MATDNNNSTEGRQRSLRDKAAALVKSIVNVAAVLRDLPTPTEVWGVLCVIGDMLAK